MNERASSPSAARYPLLTDTEVVIPLYPSIEFFFFFSVCGGVQVSNSRTHTHAHTYVHNLYRSQSQDPSLTRPASRRASEARSLHRHTTAHRRMGETVSKKIDLPVFVSSQGSKRMSRESSRDSRQRQRRQRDWEISRRGGGKR